MVARHSFSMRASSEQAHLRICATSDLHAHLLAYDYYADRPVDTFGLSRLAALIETRRAEASNSVLFDNGDLLQGNPLGDYLALTPGGDTWDVHPMIAAMNAVGYDAATIGNHDFNYGLAVLERAMAGAAYPVVLANVTRRSPKGAPLFAPFTILERTIICGTGQKQPLRIGVIGLTPPHILQWDSHHLFGRVDVCDMLEAAAEYLPQMRDAGADLVIALCHAGLGADDHQAGMEDAIIPLAALPGIDVIVAGHHHLVFPGEDYRVRPSVDPIAGTIHGKPTVMPGFWGNHLGIIDLLLERSGKGWRIAASQCHAEPLQEPPQAETTAQEDPRVTAAARTSHQATLRYSRRTIGRTDTRLHTYFGLINDASAVNVMHQAQIWHAQQRLAGTELEEMPLLSAAAPVKTGGRAGTDFFTDIPAGALALRHVADLCYYPNALRIVRIKGRDVHAWLERAARIFRQIEPGIADQALINGAIPSYNFDTFHGLTYEIDISRPALGEACPSSDRPRVQNAAFRGAALNFDQDFLVVTNSYRLGGGGNLLDDGLDRLVPLGHESSRKVLERFIESQNSIAPHHQSNWRLAALPGTSVVFESHPRALTCLQQFGSDMLAPIGEAENGSIVFRLSL